MKNLVLIKSDYTGNLSALNDGYDLAVDANIGLSAVINDMFLVSKNGYIKINTLPESFKKFEIENILTKCGVEVSLVFNKNTLEIKLKARKAAEFILEVPRSFKKIKGLKPEEFDAKAGICKLSIASGKTVSFTLM